MKKPIKLQWKLLMYISTFVLGILLLLWIFQIVLLQPLYEYNKVSILKDVATNVAKVVDRSELSDYLVSVSDQNDLCVRVVTHSEVVSTNNSGCMIDKLPFDKLYEYYNLANENGGNYLLKSDLIEMAFTPNSPENFVSRNNGDKNIVFTKIVNQGTDNESIILVNTRVTRVNAATQTLSDQLLMIGMIIFVATLILVLFLTKKIVKPIVRITNESQLLPKGSYHEMDHKKDYLEVHELNQTLAHASFQIQKADKAKRDLIANVSHDLRTPLTMITGYGEMMLDLPDETTEENIRVIVDESKRLSYIVNDLLDLSKLNENKIQLHPEVFDVSQLCKDVSKTYDQFAKKNGISLSVVANEVFLVEADPKRMIQVLHNFINNALNYSGDSKKVLLHVFKRELNVVVEVQDYGQGIDKSQLNLIWDRYYKIDKEHSRFEQGSGIGLAIVKEILELHHFVYGVRSVLDEGTTFYVEMPLTKSEG